MYDSRNRRDNLSVDITYAQVSHPSVPSIGIAKRFRLYRIHFYVYHDLTVNAERGCASIKIRNFAHFCRCGEKTS
ncbi:unnamed protein product, partial [Nesidiocoris tenuis]